MAHQAWRTDPHRNVMSNQPTKEPQGKYKVIRHQKGSVPVNEVKNFPVNDGDYNVVAQRSDQREANEIATDLQQSSRELTYRVIEDQ